MLLQIPPKVFILTLGCAMNTRDSEHLFAELKAKEGYEKTDNAKEADLILINTCSVRERPVSKLFSELGAFNLIKKEGAKIGVCGCTASHLGRTIFKRAPYVDFVLGARNVSRISDAIKERRAVYVDTDHDESRFVFAEHRFSPHSALINISIGCDKQCAYCIVPHTRGRELSIPLDLIVAEAKKAVDRGAIEVVLLGQNVNSYGSRFSAPHKRVEFLDLLEAVSEIDGIKRIRFQSPHPLHMDDRFLEVFARNEKICKHIHMPLQSGSSRILRAMKRGYTKEWFLERSARVRQMRADATISTDIIVGFPEESDEDFEETLDVMRQVRFEQLFSFKFSPRPMTAAAKMKGQIDEEIAADRLNIVQSLYKKQLYEAMNAQIGKVFDVFLESGADGASLYGRAHNFYALKVSGGAKAGEFARVRAFGVERGALLGEVVSG
ncbi:MAG: tRNA (N6-isopentenyl adenosine(37)-C2)-methylthiotransferase MiaB [Helicobacteraceae bacterium]|jgi:tRNA-2-methylthio-N6-dimethylallyladenosine synthase|nr:tRNA (N6-isopentenyl adenosine(37)-C2)-methylthiotransferase MiaB [Helicobacteraceae bacterium]